MKYIKIKQKLQLLPSIWITEENIFRKDDKRSLTFQQKKTLSNQESNFFQIINYDLFQYLKIILPLICNSG